MQKQYIKGYVTKGEDGNYRVLASCAVTDRQGDVIDQAGWDLSNFVKNPVMPWAHKYDQLPVAKALTVQVTNLGLEATFEFASAEGNPMAQQVKNLYDNGFLNAVSVGFIPKTRQGNTITSAELLEISFVPVPANQAALRLAAKSMEDLDANPLLTPEYKTILKDIADAMEAGKGAVADELDEEALYEAKCANFWAVMDVVYAFADVYFSEDSQLDDFPTLLTEVVTILQGLVSAYQPQGGSDGSNTEASTAAFKAKMTTKTMTADMFVKLYEAKTGATLSQSTIKEIDKAIAAASTVQSVLEDLKKGASAQSGDGSGEDDDGDAAEDEDKGLDLTNPDDLAFVRKALVSGDKVTELALSIVNAKMRELGAKKE